MWFLTTGSVLDFYSNRVLLVEDYDLLHEYVKNVFLEKNFLGQNGIMDSALTYEDGLQKIEQFEYDLAILDIELGKGKRRGLYLIEPCLKKGVLPIMATAYSSKTIYDRAMMMGAQGYYIKDDSNYIVTLINEVQEKIFHNKIKYFFSNDFILSDAGSQFEIGNIIKGFKNSSKKFVYIHGPDSEFLAQKIFDKCSTNPFKSIDLSSGSVPNLVKGHNIIVKNFSKGTPSSRKIICSFVSENKVFFSEDKDILDQDSSIWKDVVKNVTQIKIPRYQLRGQDSYIVLKNALFKRLNKEIPFKLRAINSICCYNWESINDIVSFGNQLSKKINLNGIKIVDIDLLPQKIIASSNNRHNQFFNLMLPDYMKIIKDCEEKGFVPAMKELRNIIAEYEISIAGSVNNAASRIQITRAGLRKMVI